MVISNIKNQSVVIIGINSGKYGKSYKLSDEYVEVDLKLSDGNHHIIETDGNVSILTLDDTVRLIESISDDEFLNKSIYTYAILHDYNGEITFDIFDTNGSPIKITTFPNKSLISKYKEYSFMEITINVDDVEMGIVENFDYVL